MNMQSTQKNGPGVLGALGMVFGGLILLGVVVVLWFIGTRNDLVTKDETINNAWSDVESQYQRRYDLIPNLVEIVKGYAAHERETFTAVTEARSKVNNVHVNVENAPNAALFQQFSEAQGELSQAMSRLMVVVEKYPELKANEEFAKLHDDYAGTENRINVARLAYNKVVKELNAKIRRFPASIVASMSGIEKRDYFKSDEGSEKAPKIQF